MAVVAFMAMLLAGCGRSAGDPAGEATTPPVEPATVPSVASTEPLPATTITDTEATVSTPDPLPALRGLSTRSVDTAASFPVLVTAPPGDQRIFIVGKEGTVWMQDREGGPETLVLDLRSRVSNRNEQGLLGLAFHPLFSQDRRAFVDYTDRNGNTVVAEFQVSGSGEFSDETILLTVPQPASNHNGGMVAFGPEGNLYVAMGDGGGANDQFGNGRDPSTLLGTLLRLDVRRPGVATPPSDNPFSGDDGAAEVWAFGLRNPWRFAFDDEWLIVADVGQQSYEEINRVPASRPGLDYGWSTMEGLHCFSPTSGCTPDGLVEPIVEVPHGEAGTCSITGGYVYRGQEIPELDGQYFYSDYCGGYLRSLRFDGESVAEHLDWSDQVGSLGQVTSFGVDGFGELFITSADGTVRRLTAQRG